MMWMMMVVQPVDALQTSMPGKRKFNLQLPIDVTAVNCHGRSCEQNLLPLIHAHSSGCDKFFQHANMSAEAFRFGEARHPGPVVVARTFNLAQLLGHEDDTSKWPDGVWTAAETSHTQAAMQVSAERFRQNDVRTVFSMPVEKHSCNAGTY